jgi:hypothetical protein
MWYTPNNFMWVERIHKIPKAPVFHTLPNAKFQTKETLPQNVGSRINDNGRYIRELDNGTIDEGSLFNCISNTNQSKTLSDNIEAILAAQGIGYLIRKGMQMCSITIDLVHSSSASPPTLASTAAPTGGYFKGATETKVLDGRPVERKDLVLGNVVITVKALTSTEELKDSFLRDGWVVEGGLNEVIVNEKAGWTNDGVSSDRHFYEVSVASANFSLFL